MYENESLLERILREQQTIESKLFQPNRPASQPQATPLFQKTKKTTKPKPLFKTRKLYFTLWDVGHGLSIWLKTPRGHNHWIDLGKSADFSPSEHVSELYNVKRIDHLIISHLHKDHLEDLPNFLKRFPAPRIVKYNPFPLFQKTLLQENVELWKAFRRLISKTKSNDIPWESNPRNSQYNGGVNYRFAYNRYSKYISDNNTSIVTMIRYKDLLVVCTGDIEDDGWQRLWQKPGRMFLKYGKMFEKFIKEAKVRILIAPHHGSKETYSPHLMEKINPHITIISDAWGASETHSGYREKPIGMKSSTGEILKYFSTKKGGRIQITVTENGEYQFSQDNTFNNVILLH